MAKYSFDCGLKIYNIYRLERFPNENILVVDIDREGNCFRGLSFNLNGEFISVVTLKLPEYGEEIGNIYYGKTRFNLTLEEPIDYTRRFK